MNNNTAYVTTVIGNKKLSCLPLAVLGFIFNSSEEVLLLSHPKRPDTWEVVNGTLDENETILDGMLRETKEEVGDEITVRPLGTIHVYNFHYDKNIRFMVSICYLLSYEGGNIKPGDDMQGSIYRWWKIDDIFKENIKVIVPPDRNWIFKRGLELYRLWKNDYQTLQIKLDMNSKGENKYD